MPRLASKELREILRDRRTIITLVLMPLIVYPLLGVLVRKGLIQKFTEEEATVVVFCAENMDDLNTLDMLLVAGQHQLPQGSTARAFRKDQELPADLDDANPVTLYTWDVVDDSNQSLEDCIATGRADLGIRLVQITERRADGQIRVNSMQVELLRRANSALSDKAWEIVSESMRVFNESWIRQRLVELRVPAKLPAEVHSVTVSQSEGGGLSLVTFIPLVLVLMTMTGAVYPAIDLTAGERERGTMEILVAAPVPRMRLLAAKFVAVLTVALMTATVNLIAMLATLFMLGIEGAVIGRAGWMVVPQVGLLLIVFAGFFSAVLLSLTSFARSFKEAQAYLIPLMLVSLTPGVFSLMPDLEMGGLLAVTPLVNTVLMGRDLMQGNVNPATFLIVLVSTTLYGVMALSLAARLFGSDAILNGAGGTWSAMFSRASKPRDVATCTSAMFCLAILFPLFIVIGTIPGRIEHLSMATRLIANGVVLMLLFGALPVAACSLSVVRLRTAFALHAFRWPFAVVAVLSASSLWMYVYEANLLLLNQESIKRLISHFDQLGTEFQTVSLPLKLACLAIVPAVFEELFFRGFLQSSLQSLSRPFTAVVASSVLFALFHVIVLDSLLFERFFPSLVMGLLLGTIRYRSNSTWPGILLHVIHNGLLIGMAHYEQAITDMGIGIAERQHLPALWLLGGSVPIAVSLWFLFRQPPVTVPPARAV